MFKVIAQRGFYTDISAEGADQTVRLRLSSNPIPAWQPRNGYNLKGAAEAAYEGRAVMTTRRTKGEKDGRPWVTEELMFKTVALHSAG